MLLNTGLLKAILFEKGIKQWQFCRQINLSENYLSKVLHKKVEPSAVLVSKIAQALNLDPRFLLQSTKGRRTRSK